jgi:hypothetical protein
MKKVLVVLSIAFVTQGSLLLGSDRLEKLYLTSPVRKTCTDPLNRYVWNTREQNDACEELRAQYDFEKKRSYNRYPDLKYVENDSRETSRNKSFQYIESDFFNDALLDTGTWDLIGKILPNATAEQKRIELEELARLKFNLANTDRQSRQRLLLSLYCK